MPDDASVTSRQFLSERRHYFHLDVVPTGTGWSIALRIDGTYFDRDDAEDVLESWKQMLPDLMADVPRDGWDAWSWPSG